MIQILRSKAKVFLHGQPQRMRQQRMIFPPMCPHDQGPTRPERMGQTRFSSKESEMNNKPGTTLHYFYNVSMQQPSCKVYTNTEAANALMESDDYKNLYNSSKFNLYLKRYDHTIQAVNFKLHASVKKVVCPAEVILSKNPPVEYVDQLTIKNALDNRFLHVGSLGSSSITDVKEENVVEIFHETIRTRAFLQVVSRKLGNEFNFDKVANFLPDHLRNPYSIVGTSKNDVCIMHRKNYKRRGKIIGGMIIVNEENGYNKENEWTDSDDDVDMGGIISTGGVMEFKRDSYNQHQSVGEMLKALGDVVARVLVEGDRIDSVVIYGLGANYKTERAILIKLIIDFLRSEARVVLSPNALQLHPALNWLLTSINLNYSCK